MFRQWLTYYIDLHHLHCKKWTKKIYKYLWFQSYYFSIYILLNIYVATCSIKFMMQELPCLSNFHK